MANPYKDGERVIINGLIYSYSRRRKTLVYRDKLIPTVVHFDGPGVWRAGDVIAKTPEEALFPPKQTSQTNKADKADKFINSVKNDRYANKVYALRALGVASRHGEFTDEDRLRAQTFIEEYFINKPRYTPQPRKKRGLAALFDSASALKAQIDMLREMKDLLNSMNLDVLEKQ